MADPQKTSGEEAMKNLYAFVVEQMKTGLDKSMIAEKLVSQGLDRDEATKVVDVMHADILQTAAREQFAAGALVPGAAGGALAALLGGGVWAAVVIGTGYEIGYIASALGVLCGYAVVRLAGGRKGIPLQVTAVATSLLGIAVGKYVTFFYFLRMLIGKEHGAEAAAALSLASTKVMSLFAVNIGAVLSGFDLLWVVLAVVAAWRIPQAIGVAVPAHMRLPWTT